MDVVKKIDKLRIARNWSINNLAMEAGLTQSTVNNLFSRRNEPKLSTLRAICNAFGITLAEFFQNEKEDINIDEQLSKRIKELSPAAKKALFDMLNSL
ncbi:MAG: helix-turn-helix domain-containing protein [Clostridia bacterium]|nr:helix-turn-helix domain-containing protein [Clostridia bacterium]